MLGLSAPLLTLPSRPGSEVGSSKNTFTAGLVSDVKYWGRKRGTHSEDYHPSLMVENLVLAVMVLLNS